MNNQTGEQQANYVQSLAIASASRWQGCAILLIACTTMASALPLDSRAQATPYYLDSAVSASGDGRSWAGAWKGFSNIDWSSIRPGDTISLSGGTSGKTYTGCMRVYSSGVLGAPITVTKGVDAGHNGTVTIINNANPCQGGIYMHNVNYVTIRGLRITTPSYVAAQTDGIYVQYGAGNILENNYIVLTNVDTTGHDDCIQSWQETNLTVRSNYCEQNNAKTTNAQGMWLTGSYGTFNVYDNIVYMPNSYSALIGFAANSQGAAGLIAYNNTLVGGKWNNIYISQAPASVIKNNVSRGIISGGIAVRVENGNPPAANIDYNVYYHPGSRNPTSYAAAGYDVHSRINFDPLINNIAGHVFTLQNISPAINAGVTLPSVATDYAGKLRPQGAAYDMGAYEQ